MHDGGRRGLFLLDAIAAAQTGVGQRPREPIDLVPQPGNGDALICPLLLRGMGVCTDVAECDLTASAMVYRAENGSSDSYSPEVGVGREQARIGLPTQPGDMGEDLSAWEAGRIHNPERIKTVVLPEPVAEGLGGLEVLDDDQVPAAKHALHAGLIRAQKDWTVQLAEGDLLAAHEGVDSGAESDACTAAQS